MLDGSSEPTRVLAREFEFKTDTYGAGGYGAAAVSANALVHSVFEEEEAYGRQHDHWIVTFDDLPA